MFGLIFRLREPLSEQGRADFARATVLSCIVGVVRGISLIAFSLPIGIDHTNRLW